MLSVGGCIEAVVVVGLTPASRELEAVGPASRFQPAIIDRFPADSR